MAELGGLQTTTEIMSNVRPDEVVPPASARDLRDLLTGALGQPVAASGISTELAASLKGPQLGPAVAALQQRGARHVMLVGFERARDGRSSGFGVEEVLSFPSGPLVRLRVELPATRPTYPSITAQVPAAQWDEREVHDIYGIVPAGHPDPRPLVYHNPTPSTFRYRPFVAHGDGVYQLPVGPIHAGIIEPGHFHFSAVGESVLFLDPRLFYTHRGIERLVEGKTFAEAAPIVERACGVCTVAHATAYSQAVERLSGIAVGPRVRLARVLLAEMERLYNHVGDLGNICAGVGFNFGTSRLAWEKERLLRHNEALSGHRYLAGAVVPGGLRTDPDRPVLAALASAVYDIDHEVRSIVRLLVRSETFMSRLHGTGVLSRSEARRLGAVGVAARASGLEDDLRRDLRPGGYEDLPVEISTAHTGDVAARFHVRAMEISVSAAIVADVAARLAGMAREKHGLDTARKPSPGDAVVVGAESPRGASWLLLMAGADGRIGRLHLRSGSYANWPVLASVVPGNVVPDFPLINKSFELCYACTDR